MADPIDSERDRELAAKLRPGEHKKEEDRLLEEALKLTFPASDPVAVNTAPEPIGTGWDEADGDLTTAPKQTRSQPTTTRGTAGPPYRPGPSESGAAAASQYQPSGPTAEAASNTVKDPDDCVTGDERMTAAQASYLQTLCTEAGEAFDPVLTKADASKRIEELQAKTGRSKSGS